MAKRGMGTITVEGVTTQFGTPKPQPQQAVMPQASPEEARLKKFYTEQYRTEAASYAEQARLGKMPRVRFQQGISQLQTKYKLAYNQAKMKIDQPDPIFKQYRDLDLYRERLIKRKAETFKMRDPWYGKPRLEVRRDLYTDEWTSKLTEQEREFAARLDFEIDRIGSMQAELIQPEATSDLMKTAVRSPRMGGAIKDQVSDYLARRETVTQRQEPEEIIERGGKRWRIVGHDIDGTPLVEEVR